MNPFLSQKRLTKHRRTWGQRMILVLNVVLIGLSLTSAVMLNYANDRASSINRVALDRSLTELEPGEPGERVINVLLVGSDSSVNLNPDDPIQIGRQGEHFGDVIIVAHVDERSGNVALLSLPRDLWVPIAGTERSDRINRAFLVGGAATLIDTIEEAFDIPIHHYVNVDFAGFQGLVDAVGSVDVYFDTPARDWNVSAKPVPRTQTGFVVSEPGCHALDPNQALAYVRSRYYQVQQADGEWVTDPTSDLGRIRRQQDFLRRLMQKAIDVGARNPLVLANLIDTGIQSVAIDQELTPALIIDLSGTYRAFEPGDLQSYTFPVTDGTVGSNRVLIPQINDASPIVELFNGALFDSPRTVDVEVVYDRSLLGATLGPTRLPPMVSAIADQLDAAGFTVSTPTQATVEPGLQLRHSADGAPAAYLVASVLDPTIREAQTAGLTNQSVLILQETTGLTGRNVLLAIGAGPEPAEVVVGLAAPAWTSPLTGGNVAAPSAIEEPRVEQSNPLGPTHIPSDLGEPQFSAAEAITTAGNSCG